MPGLIDSDADMSLHDSSMWKCGRRAPSSDRIPHFCIAFDIEPGLGLPPGDQNHNDKIAIVVEC